MLHLHLKRDHVILVRVNKEEVGQILSLQLWELLVDNKLIEIDSMKAIYSKQK